MASANDTFTAANDTLISARASDSGHTWSKVVGDGSNDIRITGNAARGAGTSEAVYLWSFVPAGDDIDVTANYDFVSSVGNALGGFVVRMDTAGTEGYVVAFNGFSDTLTVTDRDPDVEVHSQAWNAATQELVVEIRGDTFTLKVDGSTAFTDDVSHLTSNRIGLYKFHETPTDFFRLTTFLVEDVDGGAPITDATETLRTVRSNLRLR